MSIVKTVKVFIIYLGKGLNVVMNLFTVYYFNIYLGVCSVDCVCGRHYWNSTCIITKRVKDFWNLIKRFHFVTLATITHYTVKLTEKKMAHSPQTSLCLIVWSCYLQGLKSIKTVEISIRFFSLFTIWI